MKKLCLILALIMIIGTVLTACNNTPSDTSSADEEINSGDESSADTSSEENTLRPVEVAEFCTNISLGCSYTPTVKADTKYEDTYGIELTDGIFAPTSEVSYTDAAFSGYSGSELTAFVIDLGSVYDSIYHFEASYLCFDGTAGISAPSRVAAYASETGDKNDFSYVGSLQVESGSHGTTYVAKLDSKKFVKARYIKFIVTKNSAWMFLDELSVFANVEGSDKAGEFVQLLDEKYNSDKTTTASRLEAINSVIGDEIDRTLPKQPISNGCKYTPSSNALADYPDDNKTLLTDGYRCGYLAGGTWSGYKGDADQSFVIDLGKKRTDLAEFNASLYANSGIGNHFPLVMTVSVSGDNKNFVEIGKVYACDDIAQNAYTYKLILAKAVSGRYVKFEFANSGCNLMLIEELSVYAYTNDTSSTQLYPTVVFDDKPATNWPSSADGSKKQNLLLGLTQQINCGSTVDFGSYQNNSPVTDKTLTDGKYSSNSDIHNGSFFKFNRGSKRTIFYDLGYLSSIESVKASFVRYKDWGVDAPGVIAVFMSEDGKDWYQVASMALGSQDRQTIQVEEKFAKPIVTRYIAYQFEVKTWAGCDELEATGTKSIPSGAVRLNKSQYQISPLVYNGYQNDDPELLGGVRDISLMYHGVNFHNTEEILLPYVAYIGKDGKINDTMFDGFLFLLTGNFPSGAAGHLNSTMSDWNWCLDDLFKTGENIDALNKVAGEVNEALGIDKKYSFYVTLYVPHLTQKRFGDVDGDGVSEDLSIHENRLKVLNWYMDAFEARLAEANYENLSFEGYYWYNESVYVPEDPQIAKLLNETADSIHKRGYDFFWIPYFNAAGFSDWHNYGFDTACLQPNYAFKESVIESRLNEAVALIKQFHMSLELEIDGTALSNEIYYQKYLDYLSHGITDGYMLDSMHMYYQGTDIFYKAAHATSERSRSIYDYTYQFIKGTLSNTAPAIAEVSITASANTPAKGSVKAEGAKKYSICIAAEHGTVAMNNNGGFTYYPDKDFKGEDKFAFTYNNGLGESEPCYVTVTVG